MAQLRQETEKADADVKKKEIEIKNPGHGYGGKFGVEKDRMDKSAVGHDYIGKGNWIFLLLTAFFRAECNNKKHILLMMQNCDSCAVAFL